MIHCLIIWGYRISKSIVLMSAVICFVAVLFVPSGAQENTDANKQVDDAQAPGFKTPVRLAPLNYKLREAGPVLKESLSGTAPGIKAPVAMPGKRRAVTAPLTGDTPADRNKNSISVLQFNNETIYYPGSWKLSGRGEGELTSTAIHYQWDKPGRTCANDTFAWARVRIGRAVAPCDAPNSEYLAATGVVQVAGVTGKLYKRIKLGSAKPVPDRDSCPGQVSTTLAFEKYKLCYTLVFLTAEKWFAGFSPSFNGIIDSFTVKKNK